MKPSLLLVAVGLAFVGATAPASAAAPAREHVQNVRQGPLRAAYSYRAVPNAGSWLRGRIKIWSRGRLIVNRRADYIGPLVGRLISIRQLDGTGPREVLLNLYSGGLHCCWETWIFTGKRRVVRPWGDFPPKLQDVDGDGKPEFHGVDSGFKYHFTAFSGSRFPVKVWSYAGGAVHDVTSSYPAEVQADMAAHYASYQTSLAADYAGGVRAALAAYAADGYTLGQGPEAMAVVQAAVDAGETTGGGDENEGPLVASDFLDTLRRMLRLGGYDS